MAEFCSFLRTFMICGTVFFITTLVLLSLPQSRLRSVGLEISRYALAAGLFLMVPSPVDGIPDIAPIVGWLDDVGYIVGGWYAISSGLGERKKRALFEEYEMEQLRASTLELRHRNHPSDNGAAPAKQHSEAGKEQS